MNDNDFVMQAKRRLEEKGWDYHCAEKFARFLEAANQNTTNCYPEYYPLWCEFLVAAHSYPKPSDIDVIIALQEIAGWNSQEAIHHIKVEYLKGLMLLEIKDKEKTR